MGRFIVTGVCLFQKMTRNHALKTKMCFLLATSTLMYIRKHVLKNQYALKTQGNAVVIIIIIVLYIHHLAVLHYYV